MKAKSGRVKLIRISRPTVKGAARKMGRPPKVNPRVSARKAVRILKGFPGGKEVVRQLERAGKKL